jgi:SPP1 gp7 family putative phage head morphogenesis protein
LKGTEVAPKTPSAKELRKLARERFLRGRKAEAAYQRQLTSVGKQVGSLVKGFAPGGVLKDVEGLRKALGRYADLLKPWALAVTNRMHADVARRDWVSWQELGREMGRTLRKEIRNAPTGAALREAMAAQVKLITSLPTEAAERVHKLTMEALVSTAGRGKEIQEEILRSSDVTVARAKMIARTETSRTASLLLESRAKYVGSTHYRWHTVGDSDVRPLHRKLNNRVFAWDDPPIAGSSGERANPGCIYNCRCWAEPILPDEV